MSISTAFNEAPVSVNVTRENGKTRLALLLHMEQPALLHWGLCRKPGGQWQVPPKGSVPVGSILYKAAVETFLEPNRETVIELDTSSGFRYLCFVLYYPDEDSWDNNNGKNYSMELPVPELPSPDAAIRELTAGKTILSEQSYDLGDGASLLTAVFQSDEKLGVALASNLPSKLVLHWGTLKGRGGPWLAPADTLWPEGTEPFDTHAARSPFTFQEGMNTLVLSLSKDDAPKGVAFVLFEPGTGRWLKNRGRDFSISFRESEEGEEVSHIFDEIVRAETGKNSWTLMHRFNLCHDLLDDAGGDPDALALLFVWLRFSALRQLTWQRNYNTKPRELSHAQDRLTYRISRAWAEHTGSRETLRLMLTCIGRGGEGQRVRDEILNIMHRHRIKEVSGHFLEEWHQKLHNNTTPDDVVICEAFLAFLKSNGNLDSFYGTLKKNGVTRKRLESFERPIVSSPDFIPHLKDGLIHDFRDFLAILNSVHSATDLESTARSIMGRTGRELDELIDSILKNRGNPHVSAEDTAKAVVNARTIVRRTLTEHNDPGHIRDLLYLDLALEEFFRTVIERTSVKETAGSESISLMGLAAGNAVLSSGDEELSLSQSWWDNLISSSDITSREGALHSWAVLERLSRAVSAEGDRFYAMFQSTAGNLGKAIQAEPWSINLFTEEIIRGRPSFVVSLLIRRITPMLRKSAELGAWQVISPGRAQGRVLVVQSLDELSEQSFEKEPAIVIARHVHGDEEPPPGVTAVITPDTTDIVSHVAVRARNNRILFATCHDTEQIASLMAREGKPVGLSVTPSGDVVIEEGALVFETEPSLSTKGYTLPTVSMNEALVLGQDRYTLDTVGAKAFNLASLRGRLPERIEMPLSITLPFGTFEKVLDHTANSSHKDRYLSLTDEPSSDTLKDIVQTVMALSSPDGWEGEILREMKDSGIRTPADWPTAWERIKAVWASKWTPRAFRSRRALGIPHEDLHMAVIVQEAIDPDYAFVLHTVDPRSADTGTVLGELVPGLGETLVGNFPGRAMAFTSRKGSSQYSTVFYPSKSVALHGGVGLIFRSSSNGEDLPGFAGAGLYESYLYETPKQARIDYTTLDILWSEEVRRSVILALAKLGVEIEHIMGAPQDIEGVWAKGKMFLVQTRPQAGI